MPRFKHAGRGTYAFRSALPTVIARDAQTREMQGQLGPAKGKDFDTGNILGPWLVTADEIADPYDLTMVARVTPASSSAPALPAAPAWSKAGF